MAASSQRIDVILQTQRIIEMFSRAQGASVKEVCKELEINERTFYRRKDDLEKMDVPLICKGDPDAATNGKRWYIQQGYENEVRLFLTPAEKMLLRTLIYNKNPGTNIEKELSDKINKAILHDVNDINFAVAEDEFDQSEIMTHEDSLNLITESIEKKFPLKICILDAKYNVVGVPDGVKINFTDRFFEPYTIVNNKGSIYVIGNTIVEKNEYIVAFYLNALGRTEKLTSQKYTIPAEYNSEDYVKKFFKDEVPTHIKLSVNHELADVICNQKWFDQIRVEFYFDRQVVEFDTTQLKDAKKLLLSLGKAVQILEPSSLAEEMKKELQDSLSQYKETDDKNCSFLNKTVVLPGKLERESFISYGRHITNYALYNYYYRWWRNICRLEKPEAIELTRIAAGNEGLPIMPPQLWGKPEKGYDEAKEIPLSAIVYKNQIFFEYPMEREIKGDLSRFERLYATLSEDWWYEDKPCFMRWLFRHVCVIPEDEWEPYKTIVPKILLTGVDYIDSEIAKELTENGTILGHIPAVAIMYKRVPNADGTDTVESYVYKK